MPWVGFQPTIPVFERAKAFHSLDRMATVIGHDNNTFPYIIHRLYEKIKISVERRCTQFSIQARGSVVMFLQLSSTLLQFYLRRSPFCFLRPTSRTPTFGAGIFDTAGHRTSTHKLLTNEYEQNPYTVSGDEAHIYKYIHTYIHTDGTLTTVLTACSSVNNSRQIFFTVTTLSHTHYILYINKKFWEELIDCLHCLHPVVYHDWWYLAVNTTIRTNQ
jgi:hypothetical protein